MKKKGLCQNCIYNEDCMYKNESTQPIYRCEEYKFYIYPEEEKNIQTSKADSTETGPYFTGLCINCDNRKDCCLRDSNYVIWHCEEYI